MRSMFNKFEHVRGGPCMVRGCWKPGESLYHEGTGLRPHGDGSLLGEQTLLSRNFVGGREKCFRSVYSTKIRIPILFFYLENVFGSQGKVLILVV